jgi:tetratricopeptide (TPR) repeat protein
LRYLQEGIAMPERSARSNSRHSPRRGQPGSRKRRSIALDIPELPASLLSLLTGAGLLHLGGANGCVGYCGHDMLVLRIARALLSAEITPTKTAEVVGDISRLLSPGCPPARNDIEAAANDGCFSQRLAVKESCLRHMQAEQYFQEALAVEESDALSACAGYFAALDADSGHHEARINLGRLLHLGGELELAEEVYRQSTDPSALLCFNLAVLLEDLQRDEDAVVAYRHCLASDPSLHDAHFNLSRLHERANRPREALRHLTAYWRQTRTGRH